MTGIANSLSLTRIAATPAFVVDMAQLDVNLQTLTAIRRATGCRVLYSMKALPLAPVLAHLTRQLDGLSASSLFEARLAAEILGVEAKSLHLTTPGLRKQEFTELGGLCSHVSFNSLSQLASLGELASGYSKGLRINPGLSFAADPRYDPCRPHSKLGVDIALLQNGLPAGVEGLHFHTLFSGRDLQPLLTTVAAVEPLLNRSPQLGWLNIGGGYLYAEIADLEPLLAMIRRLRGTYGLEVYLEPGKALVGNAGYLLTTVLDRFDSGGKTVLVLDTSVNHHPEVFEYQLQPALLDAEAGEQTAILAGSSCMAGDVFGEYRFRRIPAVGERLAFKDVGAYSLIKASRFNGYDLPDVYLAEEGGVRLYRQFGYGEYRRQWGAG